MILPKGIIYVYLHFVMFYLECFCFVLQTILHIKLDIVFFLNEQKMKKGFYTKKSKLNFMRFLLYNIRITISVNNLKKIMGLYLTFTPFFLRGKSHF